MDFPAFIYANYPAGTSAAATGMATGQTAADVLQANEDTYISPSGTSLTLTITAPSPLAYSCLALAGENLDGVALEVRGSTDNFASSNVVISASAALSGNTSAWRAFAVATYRYWRLTFTGATTTLRLYHVVLAPLVKLPLMADGADLGNFQATTNHIISPQGHFLGTQKQKCERKLALNFGQEDEPEYQLFVAWAMACVYNPQAFFLVPDCSAATCYFGYTDPDYSFSAPMSVGLRTIGRIPFTSRFA